MRHLVQEGLGPARRVQSGLRHWRTVFNLKAELPELRLVDAVILVAIHRRKARRLAVESPTRLFADVRRYLLSSSARQRVKRYAPPTLAHVEVWIKSARARFPLP